MDNVVPVNFYPHSLVEINEAIKLHGVAKVTEYLLDKGFRPSYVKIIIRKVLRMRGGK